MVLTVYIALMSVVLLVMMKADKERARRNQYRISEKTLWMTAILGGAIGGVIGMQLFRHKTKHWYFQLFFPLMLVVQDKETVAKLSRMNAAVMGQTGTDPFYGAPTVVIVFSKGGCWLQDGSLVMGNLMNAAWAIGVGSCWINRARELFDMPEGKALLRKWGLPETLRGVGNCILGYIDGEIPAPKPRKDNYIVRV